MDMNHFEELWSRKKIDKSASQIYWDSRAEEFNQRLYQGKGDQRLHDIMALFISRGMLTNDSNVLDIGCGPGKYSIEFGKHAKSITGIDISPRMISFAKENAAKECLANVSFETLDWEEADLKTLAWEKNFDLVFASMSPAINSKNTLEKMVNASKSYCFLSTFVKRTDSVKDYLGNLINWQDAKRDFSKTIYCSFNILRLMGFYPEISPFDTEWENTYTLDKTVEMYSSHFEMTQPLSPEQRASMVDYLNHIAEDGMIKEKTNAKIAWMYWKI